MSNKQKSYPDRVRVIAEDIDCAKYKFEYDFIAKKLRELADELDEKLKQELPKEAWYFLRSFEQI